jgi:hypothetical protein
MALYDVEVSFKIRGENQFGAEETLVASEVLTVLADDTEGAENKALKEYIKRGNDVTKAVACKL